MLFKGKHLMPSIRNLSSTINYVRKIYHPEISKSQAIIKMNTDMKNNEIKMIYVPMLINNTFKAETEYTKKYNNHNYVVNCENHTEKKINGYNIKFTGLELFESNIKLPNISFNKITTDHYEFEKYKLLQIDNLFDNDIDNINIAKLKTNLTDTYTQIFNNIRAQEAKHKKKTHDSKTIISYDSSKTMIYKIPLYYTKKYNTIHIINGLTGKHHTNNSEVTLNDLNDYDIHILSSLMIYGIVFVPWIFVIL